MPREGISGHIQPYFDKKKLTSIKKEDIEDFIIDLRKNKPLATCTNTGKACLITYAMNVLAAVTGIRRGELLAVCRPDVSQNLNKNVA